MPGHRRRDAASSAARREAAASGARRSRRAGCGRARHLEVASAPWVKDLVFNLTMVFNYGYLFNYGLLIQI